MSSPSAKLFEWHRTDVELQVAQARLKAALDASLPSAELEVLRARVAELEAHSARLLAELHHLRTSAGIAE